MLKAFLLPFLLTLSTLAFSQENSSTKSFSIPHLSEVPQLDGSLDDAIWNQAALITDFHQVDPVEFSEPSQRTEVRLFYTEDALYIAARMFDDPTAISARILRQGQGLGGDDVFVVILDPYLDRRNGYQFEVNPNGLRVEGLFQNVSNVERNWTGIWETEAQVDEQGWTAEMKIPFQTISFNPESDTWGINFKRTIRRRNENIAWMSRNRQINPNTAGNMQGINNLKQGIGLDIVPSFVIKQEKTYGPLGASDQSLEPQVDLYYKITPQLNAALTINTDFSATEVDDRQVNLTRFNLFFPEKRDFFTRDADIFEFGQIGTSGFNRNGGGGNPAIPSAAAQNGRPFFSRRIGQSASGGPVDINAGAKLSGRIGNWNVGTLIVSQAEDESTGVDAREIFVGRAVLNVLSESQLGIIMTDGDPQSNENNSLAGMDFRYRNSHLPGNRILQSNFWYQQSDSPGINDNNATWGVNISSPNSVGWRAGFDYKRIEENFNPALGFVSQTGIADTAIDVGYRKFFQSGGYFRSLYVGFDGYRSEWLADGRLSSESKGLRITGNNNVGDGMFMRVLQNREVLATPFTINRSSDGLRTVILPIGDYRFNEQLIGLDLGRQRAIAGRFTYRWGDYYSGSRMQRNASLNLRPNKHLGVNIGYNESEIHLPEGDFTVRLVSIKVNIAFTSKLSWNNLVQYDNVSENMGFNSRLHWIPKAGQQAFLVFNYGLSDPDKDGEFHSTSNDLSLKVNYTFRF